MHELRVEHDQGRQGCLYSGLYGSRWKVSVGELLSFGAPVSQETRTWVVKGDILQGLYLLERVHCSGHIHTAVESCHERLQRFARRDQGLRPRLQPLLRRAPRVQHRGMAGQGQLPRRIVKVSSLT